MRAVNVIVSLALVGAAVGVVKPQSERLAETAWNPVVQSLQAVQLRDQEEFDLTQTGEYVVFVEGPAAHPLAENASGSYVDLFDTRTGLPIPASEKNLDHYGFERDGKRAHPIAQVRVQTAGRFRLHFGARDVTDLHGAGFTLAIGRAQLVDRQSLKSRGFRYGGLGLAGLLVLIGLGTLFSKG